MHATVLMGIINVTRLINNNVAIKLTSGMLKLAAKIRALTKLCLPSLRGSKIGI